MLHHATYGEPHRRAQGLEWVTFLSQRAEMAAAAGAVSLADATSWREAIERAASLRHYFFSLTQFVVWGDVV